MPVLEDAAQAAGSRSDAGRAGALGSAATFSFFPSKNLGCFGDGGMITTSDDAIAERARTLRFHGSTDKVTYEQVGYNSRLDELQAAILRVQLPHLDEWSDGRRRAGRHYEQAGLGELVELPTPAAPGASPAWHLYVVGHSQIEQPAAHAERGGVGQRPTTARPCTASRRCASGAPGAELPATEQAAARHLAIPMSPMLGREQAEEVVAACAAPSRRRAPERARERQHRATAGPARDLAHDARRNAHHDRARAARRA